MHVLKPQVRQHHPIRHPISCALSTVPPQQLRCPGSSPSYEARYTIRSADAFRPPVRSKRFAFPDACEARLCVNCIGGGNVGGTSGSAVISAGDARLSAASYTSSGASYIGSWPSGRHERVGVESQARRHHTYLAQPDHRSRRRSVALRAGTRTWR